MKKERVLVIAAHPDDEVLGMGGTIARWAAMGAEVGVLIVTDGSTSQYRNDPMLDAILREKQKETQEAAKVLGVSHVFYGGLPDMRLDMTPHIEINAAIERVVEEFAPTVVYTHFWGDVNRDHQCVYQSTLVACRPVSGQTVKELYAYSVPSSTEWSPQTQETVFLPNVFVDIQGQYAEKKYEAMSCYKTELREYPHPRSVAYLRKADEAAGQQVGLLSAESFVMLRQILV